MNINTIKEKLRKRLLTYEGLPNTKAVQSSIVSEILDLLVEMDLEYIAENLDFDDILNDLNLERWDHFE